MHLLMCANERVSISSPEENKRKPAEGKAIAEFQAGTRNRGWGWTGGRRGNKYIRKIAARVGYSG